MAGDHYRIDAAHGGAARLFQQGDDAATDACVVGGCMILHRNGMACLGEGNLLCHVFAFLAYS
jgi:hypothetical protein